MSVKEQHNPKALNIIRPSSSQIQRQESSTTSGSVSTISTLSTLSSFNNNNAIKTQPTIINPSNFGYYNNSNNFSWTKPTSLVGVNPHRFLSRPRSNSNLSKSTFFSSLSSSQGDSSEEDEHDDLDSIDGLSEEEDEYQSDSNSKYETQKVVAKVKHGTIMNSKGEYINKGLTEESLWLDEARANRKIADLEIEKTSLLVLNGTLEAKLRQQTLQIVELQKQLQMNERPLTPVSDKHVEQEESLNDQQDIENDKVFQHIRLMLDNLITQAETALLTKTKQSGKVLYDNSLERQYNVEETLFKLTGGATQCPLSPPLTPIPSSPNLDIQQQQRCLPIRRVSDSSSVKSNKMTRDLSHQSCPPALLASNNSRPFSPPPSRPSSTSATKNTSPKHSSNLRKNRQHDFDKPKWH